MPNPVVHFEILGQEGGALQQFYRDTFGWTIDANNPMNYGVIEPADGGIGGGVGPSQDGSAFVTVYLQVDDLKAALEQAEKNGATTVMPPVEVPGGPTIAQFRDPAGNVVGLVAAA